MRCVLDRDEVFNELTRHPATVRVRLGATRDGRFVAKRMWSYVNTGAYADCGPGVAQKMGYAGVGPYRFDHVAVDSYCIYTNMPPGGAFRGYGAMQSVWASERRVDMMADRLGIDAGGAAPDEPAARGRHLLHRRGHARHPLRGAPRRRREAVAWQDGTGQARASR